MGGESEFFDFAHDDSYFRAEIDGNRLSGEPVSGNGS
jgi:hypothetical protein